MPKTGRQNNFCRKAKLLVHTLLTSHHTSYLDHFLAQYQLFLYTCTPFFYIFVLKRAFWGSFTPWQDKKLGEGQKNCWNVKLFVYTLLTSHHTSSLDHFWARYQRFCHFYPKRGILGVFLPPDRGKNWWAKKILLESQTTCPYPSNKPSYIKYEPFLGALSTFFDIRAHCTGVQCVFIKVFINIKRPNENTLHARAMYTHIKKRW